MKSLLACAFVLLLAPSAWALGPVVGKECKVLWVAPSTNTDGTPITQPLGFKRYDQAAATPVPVPGTTVPVTTLAPPGAGNAPTSDPCPTASPGQHFTWVTAFYASGQESPIGPMTAWVLTLAPPSLPLNLRATGSGTGCTLAWNPPTTNSDGSALIGTPTSAPLTYLVYAAALASAVPVPGTTTPLVTQAAATIPCSAIPTGQGNVWVAAQNVNGVSGVQASPLALGAVPSTPSGVVVE